MADTILTQENNKDLPQIEVKFSVDEPHLKVKVVTSARELREGLGKSQIRIKF